MRNAGLSATLLCHTSSASCSRSIVLAVFSTSGAGPVPPHASASEVETMKTQAMTAVSFRGRVFMVVGLESDRSSFVEVAHSEPRL